MKRIAKALLVALVFSFGFSSLAHSEMVTGQILRKRIEGMSFFYLTSKKGEIYLGSVEEVGEKGIDPSNVGDKITLEGTIVKEQGELSFKNNNYKVIKK